MGVMADQKLDAKQRLELGHGRRHRGLRDVEPTRRLGDAAAVGGGDEVSELSKCVSYHKKLYLT